MHAVLPCARPLKACAGHRIYKTHLLGRPTVVVDDPEEVHRLLAKDLQLMTADVRLSCRCSSHTFCQALLTVAHCVVAQGRQGLARRQGCQQHERRRACQDAQDHDPGGLSCRLRHLHTQVLAQVARAAGLYKRGHCWLRASHGW